MLPVLRRLVAALATVALLLSLAAPVAAAEPPAGVVLDADVTVTVTETGAVAVPGATVTLLAYVTDFPEDSIQELTGVTDPAGIATFAGVARADVAGPVVHLTAVVEKEEVLFDGECLEVHSWSGMAGDVVAADGIDIPVEAGAASSIQCPPPGDGELPGGLVADAALVVDVTLDGVAVDGVVSAFLSWNGWSSIVEAVAIDGTAEFADLPRPVDPAAPVHVTLTAVVEVPGDVGGCRYTSAAEGGASLDLTDEGMVQAAIAVAAVPIVAPTLQQVITVADRDANAIAGSTVFVLQEDPSGGEPWSCTATTDDAGTVTMPLYDWGTEAAPSEISYEAHGPVSATETRGDCVLSFGPYGQLNLLQTGPVEPAGTIGTDIIELDAVCSTTGTPAPGGPVGGGGEGTPTLPPTDAVLDDGARSGSALAPVLLLLALIAALALVPARLVGLRVKP